MVSESITTTLKTETDKKFHILGRGASSLTFFSDHASRLPWVAAIGFWGWRDDKGGDKNVQRCGAGYYPAI